LVSGTQLIGKLDMTQSQFEQQSFVGIQQQVKELRQKYIGELQQVQAETRLLLVEQHRKTDLLCSRFSYDSKQISNSLHLLQKQFEINLIDS
jgi:hypothetical protein